MTAPSDAVGREEDRGGEVVDVDDDEVPGDCADVDGFAGGADAGSLESDELPSTCSADAGAPGCLVSEVDTLG